MDKNYYDILQVNINASPEIIEKAYKTLAKKYHPDLQPEENKKEAEIVLQEINEAYEILSDTQKKQQYDIFLKKQKKDASTTIPNSEKDLYPNQQQEALFQQLLQQQLQQQKQQQEQLRLEQELDYQQQLQQAKEKAYYDAYIQDLKNRGYKIQYKKSLKDYIKLLFIILIMIAILSLAWQIPFVQKFSNDLYENNEIIHWIIDFISNLLKK